MPMASILSETCAKISEVEDLDVIADDRLVKQNWRKGTSTITTTTSTRATNSSRATNLKICRSLYQIVV